MMTAALQREQQRRTAAVARAKEMETIAEEAQMKMRQAQYANRKLEDEVRCLQQSLREIEQQQQRRDDSNTGASPGDGTRQAGSSERLSLRERSQPQPIPTLNFNDEKFSNGLAVESAIQELHAIVPQYRGAITALQGRVKVLQGQVEVITRERDTLRREVSKWREAAEKHETAASNARAKLESQEATSFAATAAAQNRISRLEHELSELHRSYDATKKDLLKAKEETSRLKDMQRSQTKRMEQQSETITSLEKTVREQQEDILAALDLVSHRGSIPSSYRPNLHYQDVELSGGAFEHETKHEIPQEQSPLHSTREDVKGGHASISCSPQEVSTSAPLDPESQTCHEFNSEKGDQSPTAALLSELEAFKDWNIPVGTRARNTSNEKKVDGIDKENDNTHALVENSALRKKKISGIDDNDDHGLASVASDIAALREALRVALA